jgi:periplasmic divalent cation tolerance protein
MSPESMKGTDVWVVLVTVPGAEVADRVASAVLERHLAACVNVLPAVQSRYWWKGKLESASEVLMVFKVPAVCYERFEAVVVREHPYEVPEIVALPVQSGFAPYVKWVMGACDCVE